MKYQSIARTALPLFATLTLFAACGEDTGGTEGAATVQEPGPAGSPNGSGTTPMPVTSPTSTVPSAPATPSMTATTPTNPVGPTGSTGSNPVPGPSGMGGSGGSGPAGAGGSGMPGPGAAGSGTSGSGAGGSGAAGTGTAGSGMAGDTSMAGSGVGGSSGAGTGGSSGGGMSGGGEFVFASAEFMDGGELPEAHTCASPEGFQGAPSPSFSWSGAPEGTQSFAMVMMDKTLVDAGDNLGYHSAFWNLPADVTSLPVDLATAPEIMAADVINRGYLGPCPTLSSVPVPHVYTFTLYALPEAMVTLGAQVNAAFVEQLEEMALASVVLSCESSASM